MLGLAPDEVYTATSITGSAVGSYPAFSPLPVGGSFSVALSVALLHLGVTQHPVPRSPDFPLHEK